MRQRMAETDDPDFLKRAPRLQGGVNGDGRHLRP
jgi:hypothetical protein